MANTTVQLRISPKLKDEAETIFNAMGLKTSEAIRLFLQQTVNSGALPFRPHLKTPNETTLKAMKELENGEYETFTTAQELFDDLDD